ncbi:TrbC/VirB2 family protein [Achromobacter kerstersii]|uniref:Conjugal transfer protein TrbC n=1 Tax=Achromobacter kerstersii TaxID=1353890 RepID=A0A6S7AW18_9BURK|nr:TrbC/VirB2 family protein [Achromobacter kerstersii]CAB3744867.1 hypothetical protein LMG3441_06247 [Achromobacter kerstersii]
MSIAPAQNSRPLTLLAYLALAAVMLVLPDVAFANFEKGTKGLQTFYDWLWLIIPICAAIVGVLIGVAYSADLIRKDTAMQWGVGVVFAGAVVGGFIKLFF